MEDNIVIRNVKVVTGLNASSLCVKPYEGHKKGCPNFNHKIGCPPKVKKIEDEIDLSKDVTAIAVRFDMDGHVKKMKDKHPEWTDRQLRNCLYWQGGVKKQLKAVVKEYLTSNKDMVICMCPEAQGVNMTETMRSAGVDLEWPPLNNVWKIALVGYPLGGEHVNSK